MTAKKAIEKWLEEHSSESDGGEIGYRALKQIWTSTRKDDNQRMNLRLL